MANDINLNTLHAVALGAALFWLGGELKKRVTCIRRYNIPTPLVGGLAFALLNALLYGTSRFYISFDPTLQGVFQNAFFVTAGFRGTLSRILKGGRTETAHLILNVVRNLLQTCLGVGIMIAMGQDPGMGMAISSILCRPIIKRIIGKDVGFGPKGTRKKKKPSDSRHFTGAFMLVLFACGAGDWIIAVLQFVAGIQLSSCLGSMLVAVVLRNGMELLAVDYPSEAIDAIGHMCISISVTMAVMSVKLWELAELALPLLACLAAQSFLSIGFAWLQTFRGAK